jgi:hypothetical protein
LIERKNWHYDELHREKELARRGIEDGKWEAISKV